MCCCCFPCYFSVVFLALTVFGLWSALSLLSFCEWRHLKFFVLEYVINYHKWIKHKYTCKKKWFGIPTELFLVYQWRRFVSFAWLVLESLLFVFAYVYLLQFIVFGGGFFFRKYFTFPRPLRWKAKKLMRRRTRERQADKQRRRRRRQLRQNNNNNGKRTKKKKQIKQKHTQRFPYFSVEEYFVCKT